ncbi:MAG: hypothetical protein IH991_11680, partial [Planctomycetes bacterium]|nr:hypothetical protein [Planctomycetota bacterium]
MKATFTTTALLAVFAAVGCLTFVAGCGSEKDTAEKQPIEDNSPIAADSSLTADGTDPGPAPTDLATDGDVHPETPDGPAAALLFKLDE